MGLWSMTTMNGGCGKCANGLGGAPGVRAIVCGCSTVGKAAIEVLCNMGVQVTVADINIGTLRAVSELYNGKIDTVISNKYNLSRLLPETDLFINSVRWPKNAKEPIYIQEGVIHYCVSNMPSAIAGSTSIAYAAGVLPHLRAILNKGVRQACIEDGYLRRSLTAYKGYLTHEETSGIQNRPWVPPEIILGIENRQLDPAPKTTVTRSDNFYTEFVK